jgi:hypothetical protein
MKCLRLSLAAIALVLFTGRVGAQITVTQASFQQTLGVGKIVKFQTDTLSTRTTFNVGKKGGPNIYDFSGLYFFEWTSDTVRDISYYPYLASEYAAGAVTFRLPKNETGFEHPIFYFENSSMTQGGHYNLFPGDSVEVAHSDPHELFVKFPVTYGDSARQTSTISVTTLKSGSPIGSPQQNTISSTVVVDGWGTLKLPGNVTVNCLRFRFVEESPYHYKEFRYITDTGALLFVGTDNTQPDTGNVVLDGGIQYLTPVAVTSVERRQFMPGTPMLDQNYPNPFNPSTDIRYYIPSASEVRVSVFSILGEELDVLANGRTGSGWHTLKWNATSRPSGIYFLRFEAGNVVATRKLVLLK